MCFKSVLRIHWLPTCSADWDSDPVANRWKPPSKNPWNFAPLMDMTSLHINIIPIHQTYDQIISNPCCYSFPVRSWNPLTEICPKTGFLDIIAESTSNHFLVAVNMLPGRTEVPRILVLISWIACSIMFNQLFVTFHSPTTWHWNLKITPFKTKIIF